MFNGSAGPLLRPATPLDWAGDPFDVTKFKMEHGERSYEETLAHYRDYTDIVGDSPLNLHSTTLALNAYMLTGDAKYRAWALSYLDAWVERAAANGGILPSIVGLDGRIGGPAANGTAAFMAGASVPWCRRPGSAKIAIACRAPSLRS